MPEEGSWGPLGLLRTVPGLGVGGPFLELSPRDAGDWVSWTGVG